MATQTILFDTPVPLGSPYGPRSPILVNGQWTRSFHYGYDLKAPLGTPIKAPRDGVVRNSSDNDGFGGKWIWLVHNDGSSSRYFHLNSRRVSTGQKVKRGQIIGTVGQTGKATGPHLCIEWLLSGTNLSTRTNPLPYILSNQNTPMTNTIVVQKGWGLSHVAKAASYGDYSSPDRWQYIADLNNLGSWEKVTLKTGQVLKVKSTTTPQLVSQTAELEKKVAELTTALQGQVNENNQIKTQNAAQVEELRSQIAALESENVALDGKNQNLQTYAAMYNIQLDDAGINIGVAVLEALKRETGILAKWGNLIDRVFSGESTFARIARGFFKYNIFYIIYMALAYVLAVGVINYAAQYGIVVTPGVAEVLGIMIGAILKDITVNYDTNQDGKITIADWREME